MRIAAGTAKLHVAEGGGADGNGPYSAQRLSDEGGLSQFGAILETLAPGSRSSHRHWHECSDEFVYVLTGEAVLVEDDGEAPMRAGDVACWPAGVANAHHLVNRSASPCSFLVVGTRVAQDACHYPDSGRTLFTDSGAWRLVDMLGREIARGKN